MVDLHVCGVASKENHSAALALQRAGVSGHLLRCDNMPDLDFDHEFEIVDRCAEDPVSSTDLLGPAKPSLGHCGFLALDGDRTARDLVAEAQALQQLADHHPSQCRLRLHQLSQRLRQLRFVMYSPQQPDSKCRQRLTISFPTHAATIRRNVICSEQTERSSDLFSRELLPVV